MIRAMRLFLFLRGKVDHRQNMLCLYIENITMLKTRAIEHSLAGLGSPNSSSYGMVDYEFLYFCNRVFHSMRF